MANYSFKETLDFFSEKLKASPPETDVEQGAVELVIDKFRVIIEKGGFETGLHMKIVLGLLLQPIREDRLRELATSNFLGVNTGGCKLSLEEGGIALCLHSYTTGGSSPQESWEWLHRLLSVSREWSKVLGQWDDFVHLGEKS